MAPVTGIEGEYRWYRMRISAARADGIDSRYTRYREGQLLKSDMRRSEGGLPAGCAARTTVGAGCQPVRHRQAPEVCSGAS